MSNEIQVATSNLPTVAVPQSVIHNSGDNVTQIANNQGGVINVYMPTANGAVYNAAMQINTEYYNLFVVGDEEFKENFFLIDKDRALTTAEDVATEISSQFAALTPEAQAAIKTFPSIFASKNHQYGHTDETHLALFGVVTDIRIQENGIKIYFQSFCAIPQQRLNEIMLNLAIKGSSSFNELNRTHWTIKRINLIEELSAAGMSVLVPT
jgi:hypothetical protein